MSSIIAVIQNAFQVIFDILFKKIGFLLKKVLYALLKPVMSKKREQIEEKISRKKLPDNISEDSALTVIKVASITNALGVEARNPFVHFYIRIPMAYRDELKKHKFYENDNSSGDSCLYSKLVSIIMNNYRISDADAQVLINAQAEKIAAVFLQDLKLGKQKSNNKMFGVDTVGGEDTLILNLFITDYFTYKCLNGIYSYLMRTYPDNRALRVASLSDIAKVSPLLCNFGIGGFLSLDYSGKECYFIGKRSATVACPNMWQTSFDETFDLRDRPQIQGAHPNLSTCVERGVKEELGFSLSEHNFKIETSLFSVIQTLDRLELELFILGHCKLKSINEFKEIILQMYSAPDFENENEIIQLVPQDEVQSFFNKLEKNGEKHTEESSLLWKFFMDIRSDQSFIHRLIRHIEI